MCSRPPGSHTEWAMPLRIEPLSPSHGVSVAGVDITRPIPRHVFAEIRDAFEEHSLLVFRDQALDDDQQLALSQCFGPSEVTLCPNPRAGTYFARQSNVDEETGQVIRASDRRMIAQLASELWHSDSSFKPVPALCTLLSARVVPPEGCVTEFASMRSAYETLPEIGKRLVEGLFAEHSLAHAHDQVAPGFLTRDERLDLPPVYHPVVRTNPVNGRKALFIGAHASHILGWPEKEGRALLQELAEFATRSEFRYSHQWQEGDLVVWDNRCLLHRTNACEGGAQPRVLQCTTVAGNLDDQGWMTLTDGPDLLGLGSAAPIRTARTRSRWRFAPSGRPRRRGW
jgi:alpha-ketoglutarate-dependent 2,4-dichlorophenoxyacetate dioxygenase